MRLLPVLTCALAVGSVGCGGSGERQSEQNDCRPRATSPVSVAELVAAFRAQGLTLDFNQRKCSEHGDLEPDATSFGPSGLTRDRDVAREQGDVLCRLGRLTGEQPLTERKFAGDQETVFKVHNVECLVYPWSDDVERQQLDRVAAVLKTLE